MTKYALVYVNEANVRWYEQAVEPPGGEVEVGFHEIQFPTSISYGSRGGPGYKTSIITLQSGAEERVAHLSMPRHRYNVAEGVKKYDDLVELKKFYIARLGPANGFRFKDWLDFTSNADGRTAPSATDQNIGTGTGSLKTFQLIKRYTDAVQSVTRTITKPVASTVRVSVNDVEQVSPGWTYQWSVDTTTGVVTFTTAPPDSQPVKAGFEFDVPVRFGEEADELLDISLDAYDSGSMSVPLVELFAETGVEDDFWYGGASSITVAADVTINKGHGRVVVLDATQPSKKAYLPAKADMALGGPHFYIVNINLTNTVQVKDVDDDSTVFTCNTAGTAGDSAEIWLGYAAGGVRKWYAIG